MLYERKAKVGTKEVLVPNDCLVDPIEHMAKYRIINVHGAVRMELESINLMLAMDTQSHKPIKLIISSPGGSLDAAFLIYDVLKRLESPIMTLGTFTASAAVLILLAGTKGSRFLMPHSKTMIHLPSTQFSGDTEDIKIAQKEMESYRDRMIEIYQECGVKKSKKQILKDINREFWMNPKEAISYGLADQVMTKGDMQDWLK